MGGHPPTIEERVRQHATGWLAQDKFDDNRVQILTLHPAKGWAAFSYETMTKNGLIRYHKYYRTV